MLALEFKKKPSEWWQAFLELEKKAHQILCADCQDLLEKINAISVHGSDETDVQNEARNNKRKLRKDLMKHR